jgi:nitrogen fixation protein NifX
MRVVIATDDKKNLNGHFSLANVFMFFDISEDSYSLINEVCFSLDNSHGASLKCKNRKPFCIEERLAAIKGSDVIFVSAIGGPIADRVISNNVYPIEMNAPEGIETVIFKLQSMLKGKQPLWLKRILKHDFLFEGTGD